MKRTTINKHLRKTSKGLRIVRKHRRRIKSPKRISETSYLQDSRLEDPRLKVIGQLEVEKSIIDVQLGTLKNQEEQLNRMKKENDSFARWLKKRIKK